MIIEILQSLNLSTCDLASKCKLDAARVHKIVKGGVRPTQDEADKIQVAIGELGKFLDVLGEWPHLNAGTSQGKEDVRDGRSGVFVGDEQDEFHMEVAYETDYASEIDTKPEKHMENIMSKLPETVRRNEDVRKALSEGVAEICDAHDREMESSRFAVQSGTLRRTIAFLAADKTPKNAKICAIGLAFAGGLDEINGNAMTNIAAKMCVTRAAISKVANQAADALGIKRDGAYMRTQTAREAYRKRAKEVHARKN
jgi:transcriptional regulator with XRE-family HTH domain